jgi:large subunit ribosomal protein L25
MSTDRVTLEVTARKPDQLGSRNVRRLRKQGLIPGVLYGKASGSHAFVVGERELRTALSGGSGVHTVIDVQLDGASHTAVVKDFQRHAIRGTLTHIDLHEVRLDVAIQASVALNLIGESPGARQGGLVQQVARDVRIEALPTAIPDGIDVSIDELELGEVVRLSDVPVPAGITVLDDPETIVASCMSPRGLTEEEEEEAAAGAAAAEGEEPDGEAGEGDAPSEE